MVDDFKIAKLSTELEEAGWLGIAAAAALGLFIGMEGTPGAISSTGEGFVWSKTLHTGAEGKEFSFGIGKMNLSTLRQNPGMEVLGVTGIQNGIQRQKSGFRVNTRCNYFWDLIGTR